MAAETGVQYSPRSARRVGGDLCVSGRRVSAARRPIQRTAGRHGENCGTARHARGDRALVGNHLAGDAMGFRGGLHDPRAMGHQLALVFFFVLKKFYKFFQIFHHIKSLDACMEY